MVNAFDQFHALPPVLKQTVTSPDAVAKLEELESKYGVALSDIVIELMVKALPMATLAARLQERFGLESGKAEALVQELRGTVLKPALTYLQGRVEPQQPRPPQSPPPQPPPAPEPVQTVARPVPPPVLPPSAQPVAPAGQARTPDRAPFLIDAEDERDIVQHQRRLEDMTNTAPHGGLDAIVGGIVREHNVTFSSPDMEKRFRTVILSGLRNVRDTVTLRDVLTRSKESGGLGLSPDRAGDLIASIQREADALAAAGPVKRAVPIVPKPVHAPPPRIPAPVASAPMKPQPIPLRPHPRPEPVAERIPTTAPRPLRPVQWGGAGTATPMARRTPPASSMGKPVLHDIKHPSRPMGPSDELAHLTLEEFRSLGDDLAAAAARVRERIELLAEESYVKRAEGLAGWRRSDVYRTYISMGQQSLVEEKPIDVVVAERRVAGKPYLTAEEFQLIADLNRQLRA